MNAHVTIAALDVLRQALGLQKVFGGWAPQKGDVDQETIVEMIRKYLEGRLESGGISAWDPLLERTVEINSTAMTFLLGQSAAFNELRQAAADAVSPNTIETFLATIAHRDLRLSRFEEVLPELSNMLGGPFKPGQVFSVSATELFSQLKPPEQHLLRQFFRTRIRELKQQRPDLVRKYEKLFR